MPWATTGALCTANPLRFWDSLWFSEIVSCGAEGCFLFKNRLRLWNWLPLPSRACNGHIRDEVGESHQKCLFYLEVFVRHTFFLLKRLFNPFLYFPLLLLTVFCFLVLFILFYFVIFILFSRGLFSYSIGASPPLTSPIMAQMSQEIYFKYLLVQSSSLLILLSVSTHSILKKKQFKPFSLSFCRLLLWKCIGFTKTSNSLKLLLKST